MNDGDGNIYALNKYLAEQERAEKHYDYFLEDIEDELDAIREAVRNILSAARDYNGYDFTEEAIEEIKDIL